MRARLRRLFNERKMDRSFGSEFWQSRWAGIRALHGAEYHMFVQNSKALNYGRGDGR
jgi:hypothetical protein